MNQNPRHNQGASAPAGPQAPAPRPPQASSPTNLKIRTGPTSTQLEEMEHELEALFDRADALMIQDKKYEEAVSYYFYYVLSKPIQI